MIYKEASVSSAKSRQENVNGSRHIRLCDRRSIINGRRGWVMKAGGISLKIVEWNQEKLQDSWQGDTSDNKRIRKLETLAGRCTFQVWDLDRL